MSDEKWRLLLKDAPPTGPGSLEDMAKAILQLVSIMPVITPNATGYSHAMGLIVRRLWNDR